MKKLLCMCVLSVLLVSCGSSVNPVLQKKITDLSGSKSTQTYNISGTFTKAMPYAVGQWVMYCSTNDGKKSISKTSLVGQEQGGWIIETYQLSEDKETASQMLVKGIETIAKTGNLDDIELVWVKTKDEDGKISTIDGVALSIVKGLYKKMLPSLVVDIKGSSDGGSVTVPAGIFSGTSKAKSEVSFFGSKYTSEVWYHSSVPINAMIKSFCQEENMTMELINFGTSGAKSEF